MIRLFVTDVDHTLYDSNKKGISSRNIQAIEKMLDNGICVVLASGRVLHGMKQVLDILNLSKLEYVIVNNGAELYEIDAFKKIKDFAFTKEEMQLFEVVAKEHGVNFSICQDAYTLTTGLDSYIEYDYYNVGIDLYWVHDILSKISKPIYRCSFTGDVEIIIQLEKKMKELYGHQYFFNIPHPGYLDVSLMNVNKGNAVQEIAKMLNITNDEIACIGDADNDVPMFKIAGMSACVGNGSALAKESATYVVDTCAEDGFAKFVEQYILEENA